MTGYIGKWAVVHNRREVGRQETWIAAAKGADTYADRFRLPREDVTVEDVTRKEAKV